MVHIYTDMKYIPNNLKLINDIDSYFVIEGYIENNPTTREILRCIDKCAYHDRHEVVDRFGRVLSIQNLSSGSKALLLAQVTADRYVVNLYDFGHIQSDVISSLTNGNLYIDWASRLYDSDIVECNGVYVNNILYNSFEEADIVVGCIDV